MNLKEMLSEVLGQSGFIQKQSYAGSVDVDDIQMVSIANRAALEIRNFYPWEQLRKEHVVEMVAGTTLYNLPDDFLQYVPNSGWQDEGCRQIELPVPDGRWYMYQNSAFSDGGTYRCRLRGKKLEIFEPDAGQKIIFYYVSNAPVVSQEQVLKERFDKDTDEWGLDDQLLILGIQAYWAETKLLPQAQQWMTNYRFKMNEAIGRDAGGRTIGGFAGPSNNRNRSPYYPLWRS